MNTPLGQKETSTTRMANKPRPESQNQDLWATDCGTIERQILSLSYTHNKLVPKAPTHLSIPSWPFTLLVHPSTPSVFLFNCLDRSLEEYYKIPKSTHTHLPRSLSTSQNWMFEVKSPPIPLTDRRPFHEGCRPTKSPEKETETSISCMGSKFFAL